MISCEVTTETLVVLTVVVVSENTNIWPVQYVHVSASPCYFTKALPTPMTFPVLYMARSMAELHTATQWQEYQKTWLN